MWWMGWGEKVYGVGCYDEVDGAGGGVRDWVKVCVVG